MTLALVAAVGAAAALLLATGAHLDLEILIRERLDRE